METRRTNVVIPVIQTARLTLDAPRDSASNSSATCRMLRCSMRVPAGPCTVRRGRAAAFTTTRANLGFPLRRHHRVNVSALKPSAVTMGFLAAVPMRARPSRTPEPPAGARPARARSCYGCAPTSTAALGPDRVSHPSVHRHLSAPTGLTVRRVLAACSRALPTNRSTRLMQCLARSR